MRFVTRVVIREYFNYAGFTREFPDTQVLGRFEKAWEAIFEEGEDQRIIQKFGLEPAP
jgi:hypothetical protein